MIWKVKKRFLLNGNVITLISSLQFAARWIYFFTKSTNKIRWNSLFEIKIWKIQKIIFRLGQLGILKCFVICLVLWAFIYPYCILSVWYNLDLKLVQKCIANVFLSIYNFFLQLFEIILSTIPYTFHMPHNVFLVPSLYIDIATLFSIEIACLIHVLSIYKYIPNISHKNLNVVWNIHVIWLNNFFVKEPITNLLVNLIFLSNVHTL